MRQSSEAFFFAPRRARSGTSIAVVEAHHAAIRSSCHSSMKADNSFQLRVVGVTIIRALFRPGFSLVGGLPETRAALIGRLGQQVA